MASKKAVGSPRNERPVSLYPMSLEQAIRMAISSKPQEASKLNQKSKPKKPK